MSFAVAFSSQGVQASNSSLPKRGKKKSSALIFVKGEQVREQRNGEREERQEDVEGSWGVERSDRKVSFHGQGCEEEDKGLKAETDGV